MDYLLGRGTATSRWISVAGEEEVNFASSFAPSGDCKLQLRSNESKQPENISEAGNGKKVWEEAERRAAREKYFHYHISFYLSSFSLCVEALYFLCRTTTY